MGLNEKQIKDFQKTIYSYYQKHGRKLPWHGVKDPYNVLVSEIMLQQTQVTRVLQKYPLFIKRFPNTRALARAPFSDILSAWIGLGYNRRARFLHEAAKIIVKKYGGKFPRDAKLLVSLPGIGSGTAGALLAFAYNKPAVFIETNIRSVFIHHFFSGLKVTTQHSNPARSGIGVLRGGNLSKPAYKKVHDKEILLLIERTLDKTNPRQWYSALMDYGVMLKEKYPNPSRKSAHYTKQSPFKNSNRQIRGKVLKLLVACKFISVRRIKKQIQGDPRFVSSALQQLQREGFIKIKNCRICLVT